MAFGSSKRRKHSKPGKTTLRAFHFRIEATPVGATKLHHALSLALELRNDQAMMLEASRQEARAAKLRGEEPQYLSANNLQKAVSSERAHPKFKALHSQVRQNISVRVSEGQKRWFEAIKEGRRHVRPPGMMARKHFRSITYPQYGTAANIKNGVLHLSKLGDFRLIGWRKMRGAKKSITIKFKEGHFWAIVMCEVQELDVCRTYTEAKESMPDTGMDPGLTAVLVNSFGKSYDTPKPLKRAQAKLRHIQKDVSRKFEVRKNLHIDALAVARKLCERGSPGARAPVAAGLVESLRSMPYSNRLKLNIKKLACAHTKVERIRCDVARKNARSVEKNFARVAVEEHSLQFMVKNRRLAKATADVAIGKQKQALRSALGKGRYFEALNRRAEGGNSQTCLCGAAAPKTLKMRWHKCSDPMCGLGVVQPMPRDQMSAIICQYETFGTLPEFKEHSTPGLGVLERGALFNAVAILETRRGETKRKVGESRPARPVRGVFPAQTSEASVKRPAQRRGVIRNTTGADKRNVSASVEVKTTGHANHVRSWLVETKVRVKNAHLLIPMVGVSPVLPRSILLQVGE